MLRFAKTFVSTAVAALLVAAPAAANEARLSASDARTASFSSENVEWVDILPQHTGTSGGALVGKYYYVTDPRGLFIYNVSDPAAPQLEGQLLALQMETHAALAQEDPETNGKILLVNAVNQDGAASPDSLLVIDVRDKTAPKVVGSIATYDHTWSCVLNCKYAIGRTGYIVDLRKPAEPKVVGDWRKHVSAPDYLHDFIEVAPGRLIGAGQPSFYLDMRNPLKPKELTRFDPGFHSLGYHGAAWPNGGKDPLLVMGAEVAPAANGGLVGSDCTDKDIHAVATYDARKVVNADRKNLSPAARKKAGAHFRKLQEWRVSGRGVYADGNAPGHTLYCGHWFDAHPKWRAGGILALAHYDWGARFLKVAANGKMKQVGWFQPVQGHTASTRWISNDIVYVHDYRRGLEILRVKV